MVTTWPRALAWAGYGVASVIQLGAQLIGSRALIDTTIAIPMPLLALAVVVHRWGRGRDRTTVLLVVAILCCWAGDTLGALALMIKLGWFLIAQLGLILAFWPQRRAAAPSHPLVRTGYLVVTAGLIVLLAPGAGSLVPVVAAYGCALGLMALLATGLGRRGALGGALFLISDALLAGQLFVGWSQPLLGTAIMATYLASMGLMAAAVLARRAG